MWLTDSPTYAGDVNRGADDQSETRVRPTPVTREKRAFYRSILFTFKRYMQLQPVPQFPNNGRIVGDLAPTFWEYFGLQH